MQAARWRQMESPRVRLWPLMWRRQQGRLQDKNVIDVGHDKQAIKEAVEYAMNGGFRKSLAGMTNPYGDGHASERIVETLSNCVIDEKVLFKALMY